MDSSALDRLGISVYLVLALIAALVVIMLLTWLRVQLRLKKRDSRAADIELKMIVDQATRKSEKSLKR